MKNTLLLILVALLVGISDLLVAVPTLAQAPQTLSYQGVLKNDDGTAVPDGDYDLTFHIYDTASGGTALWTEAKVVPVVNATFNAILGSTVTLDLPFDQPYWLGIQVEGNPELTPRVRLTAAPYALNVADGKVVKSLNSLTDDVTLAAGANVSISPSGNTLTFSATGTGADSDWVVDGDDMHAAVSGNVGVGTSEPMSELHVQSHDVQVPSEALHSEDLVVESQDAILGLFSTPAGNSGSGISFGEVSEGALVDKWSLLRESTRGDGGLRLNYGTNADAYLNSTVMYLDESGAVGIGTTNPGATLEVAGQLKITGGSPGEGKVLTSGTDGTASWEAISVQYTMSPNKLFDPDLSDDIVFRHWAGYVDIEAHSSPQNCNVNFPVDIPSQISGVQQKLQSITVFYRVEDPGDYITGTYVYCAEHLGSPNTLIGEDDNRNSTTWTSYTLTDDTPEDISGSLTIQFWLHWNGSGSGHEISIGSVLIETTE